MTGLRSIVAATKRFRPRPNGAKVKSQGAASKWHLKREWIGDVLFGVAPVFSALEARRRDIYKLCLQEGMDVSKRKDRRLISHGIRKAREQGIEIQYHSKHDLNMMAEGHVHQGFLLDCSRLEFEELQYMPAVQGKDGYPIWLALDEVHDPHNLGAMIRTAVFLGVDGVVVAQKNSAPLSPTVSKVSAGGMEILPVHASPRMQKLLSSARQSGWQILGSDVTDDAIPYEECTVDAPTILVMGNEARGLRQSICEQCSRFVKVQQDAKMENALLDSLNVSVAAGILLGQLTYSRRQKSHGL